MQTPRDIPLTKRSVTGAKFRVPNGRTCKERFGYFLSVPSRNRVACFALSRPSTTHTYVRYSVMQCVPLPVWRACQHNGSHQLANTCVYTICTTVAVPLFCELIVGRCPSNGDPLLTVYPTQLFGPPLLLLDPP